MLINSIHAAREQFKAKNKHQLMFTGVKEDREEVSILSQKSGDLTKIETRKITEAIHRLSLNGSTSNILFLLDVASNLMYGYRENSTLGKFINEKSSIADKPHKQNSEWELLLKNATKNAIDRNNTDDWEILKQRFNVVFNPKSNEALEFVGPPFEPERPLQNKLVFLRNHIMRSELLRSLPDENPDKIAIKKNLDYFLALSETDIEEKEECLSSLNFFVSKKYTINPQLKDKKVQILSEILNDLIVKTPESDELTIKKVGQVKHGMCAAISFVRKALPHEFKLSFIATVLSELDDKPTIEIYDVTSPDLNKTVKAQKADIDYNQAIKEGYRIIDASVTNWMHIAKVDAEGISNLERFEPFDSEHFGIFRDGFYLVDMEEQYKPKQYLFRALEKLKEASSHIDKAAKISHLAKERIDNSQNTYIKTSKTNREFVIGVLNEKFKDEELIKKIADFLLVSPTDTEKDPLKLYPHENRGSQTIKITKYLMKNDPSMTKLSARRMSNKIIDRIMLQQKVEKELTLNKNLTRESNINNNSYLEDLFLFAASDRVRRQFELEIPELREKWLAKLPEKYNKTGSIEKQKAEILRFMENNGIIFKKEQLEHLQDKLNARFLFNLKNEAISVDGKIKKPKEYYLTPEEKNLFKAIEADQKTKRHEITREFQSLEKDLKPQLEKAYAKAGANTGHFWIGQEGSSGLSSRDEQKLAEQILGENFYIETNVKDALDEIALGIPHTSFNCMVSDKQFSAHAMHIYDIADTEVMDEKGHKTTQKTVFFDNTWRRRELKKTWKDGLGNRLTDYGNDYGGPAGFVVTPEVTAGLSEEFLVNGKGVNLSEFRTSEDKFGDGDVGTSYFMGLDAVIAGTNPDIETEKSLFIKKMIEPFETEHVVDNFMDILFNGNVDDANYVIYNVTTDLIKLINESIDKEKIETLTEQDDLYCYFAKIAVENAMKQARSDIFPEGSKRALIKELGHNLYEQLKGIIKSDIPVSEKKIKTANIIEETTGALIIKHSQKTFSLQIEFIKNMNKMMESTEEKLLEQICGKENSKDQGIKSKEEFDKIPENSELKFILKKMILSNQAGYSAYISENIDLATNKQELDEAEEMIFQSRLDLITETMCQNAAQVAKFFSSFKQELDCDIRKEEDPNGYKKALLGGFYQAYAIVLQQAKQSPECILEFEYLVNYTIDTLIKQISVDKISNEDVKWIENFIKKTMKKTIDQRTKVNDEDDIMGMPYAGKSILNILKNEFHVKSDKTISEKFQELCMMPKEEFDKLLDSVGRKHVTIDYEDPYEIVKSIKRENYSDCDDFSQTVREHVLYKNLMEFEDGRFINEFLDFNDAFCEWSNSPEGNLKTFKEQEEYYTEKVKEFIQKNGYLAYKGIQVQLSYLSIFKNIKNLKGRYKDKYGVYWTIPEIKVCSDKEIRTNVEKNISKINELIENIPQEKQQLETILTKFGKNSDEYKNAKKQFMEILNNSIHFLAKVSVRPKYQDEAISLLNLYIKKYNTPEKEKIKEDIVNFFIKNFIIKEPNEFLEYIIETVPKMNTKNASLSDIDQSTITAWRAYLNQLYNAAMRSELCFDIISKISDGIMPEIARDIKSTNAINCNNKTIKIDSLAAMSIFLSTFGDDENDNFTARLLFKNMGLTKKLIDEIIKQNPIKNRSALINKQQQKLIMKKESFANIKRAFDDVFTNTSASQKISQERFDSFAGKIRTLINNKNTTTDDKKIYTEYLNSLVKSVKTKLKEGTLSFEEVKNIHSFLLNNETELTQEMYNMCNAIKEELIYKQKLYQRTINIADDYPEKIPAIQEQIKVIKGFEEKIDELIAKYDYDKTQTTSAISNNKELNKEFQEFFAAINSNQKSKIEEKINELINNKSPLINLECKKILFSNKYTNNIKSYILTLLINRQDFEPIIRFAEEKLAEIKAGKTNYKNMALSSITESLTIIAGIKNNPNSKKVYPLLKELFEYAFNPQKEIPVSKEIYSVLVNEFVDNSMEANRMLYDIMRDKTVSNGSKIAIVQLLKNSATHFTRTIIEDTTLNPQNYTEKYSDRVFLQAIAIRTLNAKIVENPNYIPEDTIKRLRDINLADIQEKAILDYNGKSEEIVDAVNFIKNGIESLNTTLDNYLKQFEEEEQEKTE